MNKEMQIKQFRFEATETKQAEINGVPIGIVRGYASVFSVDRENDKIMPGAFKGSLARHAADGNRPIRLLSQHKSRELPIGGIPTDKAFEDEKGLFIEAQINLEVQEGKEAYALAKQGVLSDFSAGFNIKDADFSDGIRLIKEVELWEVSLVGEPMNPDAKVVEVKSATEKYFIDITAAKQVSSKKEFEKVLRESKAFSIDAAKYLAARFELSQREADGNDEAKSDVVSVSLLKEMTSLVNQL